MLEETSYFSEEDAQAADFWNEVYHGDRGYLHDTPAQSGVEARRAWRSQIRKALSGGARWDRWPIERGSDYAQRRFTCASLLTPEGQTLEIIVRIRPRALRTT